jgi:glycosyltransferase 2 family protein
MKKIALVVIGCIISLLAIIWVAKGVEWSGLKPVLADLPAWVPLAALTLYLMSFVPRAYRSLWMLSGYGPGRLTLKGAGEAQVMGYAANNVLPLRLGEFVRVFALRKLGGIPSLTGLGSLLAERILDGSIVVLILGGTITWFAAQGRTFGQTPVEPLLFTGLGLFSAAVAGLLLLALASARISEISGRRLPEGLHKAVGSVLTALAFLRNPWCASRVVLLSLLIWLIEGSVFVLATWSFGVPEPWMTGLFMLAVVNLGILLPSAPGYVGVFQACGILAFQALGLPREQGLAASLLVHSCQFLPITALGLLLASRHGWSIRTMAEPKSPSVL